LTGRAFCAYQGFARAEEYSYFIEKEMLYSLLAGHIEILR